jgi:FkbM family methyltransferase
MKLIHGIALPDTEQHYVGTLTRLMEEGVSFEYPVLRKAMDFIPEGRRRVAVDVGGHVGLWSRWLVKRFQSVHAFEPVEEYADLFQQNVAAKNVKLHRVALGDGYGAVSMKTYPDNTGQAHINGAGDVVMLALDTYNLTQVDFLKVDVEGYELPVLKGAERTLKICRPVVVVEQRGCDQINFQREKDEAVDWLQSIGMVPLDCVNFDWIMGWKPQ